jgi:hypothetical protein
MDATIAPLPPAVIEYMAAFALAALCRDPDGRTAVARNPPAWRGGVEAAKAGLVIRAASRHSGGYPGG